MKYARLIYGYNRCQSMNNQYANIGDYMQTFAIDELYEYMKIPQSDIINVGRQELVSYDGEEAILPMQGWFGYVKGLDIFPLSTKLKPVFFGYHSVDKRNYQNLELYRKNGPIGCRDESTYKIMQRKHIDSYISG